MGFVMRPLPREGVVRTSVYERVEAAVEYTLTLRYPSVIRGPAGIGKTTALANIAWNDRKAALISASSMQKHVLQMMRLIADALDIWQYGRSSYEIYSSIVHTVPERAASGRYLIIDEAHRLNLDTIREIFDLWENCGLPIILCGNNEVAKKTRTQAATFDQISSRIGKEVSLSRNEPNDFVMLGIERNVEGRTAYDALTNYGMRTSMREAAQLLDAARLLAGPHGSIQLQHLQDTVDHAFGSKRGRPMLAPE
jgi:DNA transposition AAA+ family ATPase